VNYREASGATVQERVESGQFSRDVVVAEGEPLFVSARSASLTFVTATIQADGTLLMAAAARGNATATATCCSTVVTP
jgi:sensor domain CHASE-containing protein